MFIAVTLQRNENLNHPKMHIRAHRRRMQTEHRKITATQRKCFFKFSTLLNLTTATRSNKTGCEKYRSRKATGVRAKTVTSESALLQLTVKS